MVYAGLDLSRRRLDVRVLDVDGATLVETAAPPDRDGLAQLAERLSPLGPIRAAIESMTGARFVHDELERAGWEVELADAQKVKGLAPLACKTDRIDAWVLAELSRRDFVPAIWLPDPAVRQERERARFRLHLVRHRTALKNRIHQTLVSFGVPCPVSDLFGAAGRQLLERLRLPDPWRENVVLALAFVDDLDRQIDACERELRRLGADHRYVPLLMSIPGIAWVLGYTIAAEIGDITRFASPRKLAGYTGLCPRVYQSGDRDRRGPLAKNGPRYLRSRAHRGRPARRPLAPLPRALPAHQAPARQEPRRQGGQDRGRPQALRGDLVDAQQGPTVCSGRRHDRSGRMTALD